MGGNPALGERRRNGRTRNQTAAITSRPRRRSAARLRALVITPDFPPALGGIQSMAYRLVSHFERATAEVQTIENSGARDWDAAHPLDVRRVPACRDHRLTILRLNAAAVARARSFRPDVIVVFHIVAGPAAAIIRHALHVPVVTYLHAKEVTARPRLARHTLAHSDRIIAVSSYTAGLATQAGADPDRIRVIPPGVEWREPPTARRLDQPTVITVSRLEDRYKGHDVMVRAMQLVRTRVPRAQWIIVGDGSLRGDIEQLVASHGMSDVIRLRGAVSDAERDDLLSRSHMFAMPSRLPERGAGEGFGIVYLEAGVHALPVVAGGVGGAVDAVVDGATGLLVDPTDHGQVAEAVSHLLVDREAATRMGAAGSEHARAFTWDKIAPRVEAVLAEAAGSG